MTPRRLQSRDEQGNVIGAVELVDGSIETVEELAAWADDFETAEVAPALTPPRRRPGRPSLDTAGESPRVIARVPQALIDRTDRAAEALGSNRAELVRAALEQWLNYFDRDLYPSPTIDALTVTGALLSGEERRILRMLWRREILGSEAVTTGAVPFAETVTSLVALGLIDDSPDGYRLNAAGISAVRGPAVVDVDTTINH